MAKTKLERSKPIASIGTATVVTAAAGSTDAGATQLDATVVETEASIPPGVSGPGGTNTGAAANEVGNADQTVAAADIAAGGSTDSEATQLDATVVNTAASIPSGVSVPDGTNTSVDANEVGNADQSKAHDQTGPVAAVGPVTPPHTPESDRIGEAGNTASLAEIHNGDDYLRRLEGDLAEMEATARKQFPLFFAALDPFMDALSGGGRSLGLKVSSRVDGFRRAGLRHPAVEVTHAAEQLGAERIEAILAEPQLTAELVVVE